MFGLFNKRPAPAPAPEEPLCLVFIPALVVVLHHVETQKGQPLTEAEVLAIRDKAVCMAMPFSAALDFEERRGYADIVAENAWQEWQVARLQLGQS